ncbi:MAG TPA: hypothetical protein DEA08_08690 [Planctomycetes bacterium]|nr:hypothetical protein [Planctomycetota bacterium]
MADEIDDMLRAFSLPPEPAPGEVEPVTEDLVEEDPALLEYMTESVYLRLGEAPPPPLLERMRREALALVRQELNLPQLTNSLGESVLQSVWRHLNGKGLAGFPPRVMQEILDHIGAAGAAGGGRAGGEAPAPAQPGGDQVQQTAQQAAESIWSRLSSRGLGGFPPRISVEVDAAAGRVVESVVTPLRERLEALTAKLRELEAAVADNQPSKDRHFLALAREVKTLRERVAALEQKSP